MGQAVTDRHAEDVNLAMGATGDVSAFGRFYDQLAPSSYRVALALLGDTDRAQVALESAFLQAWAQSPGVDLDTTSTRTWFLALVQRTARRPECPGTRPTASQGRSRT